MSVDKCSICLCELENDKNKVSFECGHTIHFTCFMEYMTSTHICEQRCMLCRRDLYSDEIITKMHDLKCYIPEDDDEENEENDNEEVDVGIGVYGEYMLRQRNMVNELTQIILENETENEVEEDTDRRVRNRAPSYLKEKVKDLMSNRDHWTISEILSAVRNDLDNVVTRSMVKTIIDRMFRNNEVVRVRRVGSRAYEYGLVEL